MIWALRLSTLLMNFASQLAHLMLLCGRRASVVDSQVHTVRVLMVSPAEYQSDVGLTWVEWGGEWGGAGDVVHFELPGASARAKERGKSLLEELARKYNDLPWWATIAAPIGLTNKPALPEKPSLVYAAVDKICRESGLC